AEAIAIDCVILDYHMPGMNGAQVARAIRAIEAEGGPSLPVIMLTSVDQTEEGKSFSSLGIAAHLTKPARSSLLLETIVSVLSEARGGGIGAADDEECIAAVRQIARMGSTPSSGMDAGEAQDLNHQDDAGDIAAVESASRAQFAGSDEAGEAPSKPHTPTSRTSKPHTPISHVEPSSGDAQDLNQQKEPELISGDAQDLNHSQFTSHTSKPHVEHGDAQDIGHKEARSDAQDLDQQQFASHVEAGRSPDEAQDSNHQNAPLDILVAEDNEVNQILFTQILAATGYSFQIAGNGAQAVRLQAERSPRLILMDVSMPEMNGLEATGHIREHEEATGSPRTPIIGVTAHAIKGDREKCIDAGMDDYLSKPVSPDALTEKVNAWLTGERRQSA
ncbi:MAG: response regulator, partial [Parvibaculum sp.]